MRAAKLGTGLQIETDLDNKIRILDGIRAAKARRVVRYSRGREEMCEDHDGGEKWRLTQWSFVRGET